MDVAQEYNTNHPSYITGRSAPTTPGILSRNSSRKQLTGWGLSRKSPGNEIEIQPANNTNISFALPLQTAIENKKPQRNPSAYIDEYRPKSKSETRLQVAFSDSTTSFHDSRGSRSGTTTPYNSRQLRPQGPGRAKTAIDERGRNVDDPDDNWLTRATSFTSSILKEGKGTAWSTHSSSGDLKSISHTPPQRILTDLEPSSTSSTVRSKAIYYDALDSETEIDHSTGGLYSSYATRHHYPSSSSFMQSRKNEVSSPTTPLAVSNSQGGGNQQWGSRFGSRPSSRTPSRRNSISKTGSLIGGFTPMVSTRPLYDQDKIDNRHAETDGEIRPDFVNVHAQREIEKSLRGLFAGQDRIIQSTRDGGEDESEDDAKEEEEEEQLEIKGMSTAVPGVRLIEKLLTVTNDEHDEEEKTINMDDKDENSIKRRRNTMPDLQNIHQSTSNLEKSTDEKDGEETSGWKDVAWLLGVMSKVLL